MAAVVRSSSSESVERTSDSVNPIPDSQYLCGLLPHCVVALQATNPPIVRLLPSFQSAHLPNFSTQCGPKISSSNTQRHHFPKPKNRRRPHPSTQQSLPAPPCPLLHLPSNLPLYFPERLPIVIFLRALHPVTSSSVHQIHPNSPTRTRTVPHTRTLSLHHSPPPTRPLRPRVPLHIPISEVAEPHSTMVMWSWPMERTTHPSGSALRRMRSFNCWVSTPRLRLRERPWTHPLDGHSCRVGPDRGLLRSLIVGRTALH